MQLCTFVLPISQEQTKIRPGLVFHHKTTVFIGRGDEKDYRNSEDSASAEKEKRDRRKGRKDKGEENGKKSRWKML